MRIAVPIGVFTDAAWNWRQAGVDLEAAAFAEMPSPDEVIRQHVVVVAFECDDHRRDTSFVHAALHPGTEKFPASNRMPGRAFAR